MAGNAGNPFHVVYTTESANAKLPFLCVLPDGGKYFGCNILQGFKEQGGVLEFAPSGVQPANLYFHLSNFSADNRLVIFAGSEFGKAQIFAYDVGSRQINVLTTGDGVSSWTACPHPTKADLLYYLRGPHAYERDLSTKKDRFIGEIPSPRIGGSQQPTLSQDGQSLTMPKQRDAGYWEIGMMDIASGTWRTVITQWFCIGHVQHHPKLPIIFYVWETGGYAPQRTWLVNDDGSANRPFYFTADPKQWITPL